LDGMRTAVEEQQVDFVLTNPGQAVKLGRQYELSWVATLTSRTEPETNYGIGSALVVKRDSPYQTALDVAGLPIAAVSEIAFGGYLTLRYQLAEQGLDPNDFFSDARFLGFPIDANLYQLRDANVEAAVVPVCLLENMSRDGLIEQKDYRVLNLQPSSSLGCQASTPLYPNWSLAKTARGSEAIAKELSRALLSMPSESTAAIAAGAAGWTSPVSLLSIDKLYQALDLHPLQQPWWSEALRWLRIHQEWAWAALIFFIVINDYHFWLEYRFSRSKRELEQTLHDLKEKSEMLEHSQRVAIVGELGTSLAHEINQPLAAIRNYSEGGALRVSKNKPIQELLPVFERIQRQVERADAIVQRLRTLIQKREVEFSKCDLTSVIDDSIEMLAYRFNKQNILIKTTRVGIAREVVVDRVGIQQVIVNLLTNAAEACAANHSREPECELPASIDLETRYGEAGFVIEVIDNGTGLQSDAATEAFVTTKAGGLGLGLTICRDVAEKHQGELQLQNIEPHGCRVTLTIPYLTANKERRHND
ncbi:sensor histidine kinase, partial [Vibrio paucivorans]